MKEGFNHHHSADSHSHCGNTILLGTIIRVQNKEQTKEASQIYFWEDGSAWQTSLPLPAALFGVWASNSQHFVHFQGEDSPWDKNTHPVAETKEQHRAVSDQLLCCSPKDGHREEGIWTISHTTYSISTSLLLQPLLLTAGINSHTTFLDKMSKVPQFVSAETDFFHTHSKPWQWSRKQWSMEWREKEKT